MTALSASHRRRRIAALLVVALAAVLVPAAVALRAPVVDFVAGKPPPVSIERDFADFNRGWPDGMAGPGVIASEVRQVLEVPAPGGGRSVLWVAPTEQGNFCWLLQHVDAGGRGEAWLSGCGQREGGRMHAGAAVLRGAVTVTGRVRDRSIARLTLRHADGARVELPFVRVSEPIGVGFFVHPITPNRLERGRPVEVIAYDGVGAVVRRERLG